jgi:hypothetical protein
VQAAAALSILALSSSSEGDEGDDDDSLDSHVMTNADKRRLVALCTTKARARGGERVRGVARRASEKNERTCFRRLVTQLIDSLGGPGDDDTREKDARATSRKARREESGPEDYFHREKNRTLSSSPSSSSGRSLAGPRKVETHVVFDTRRAWSYFPINSVKHNVAHLNELSGWRWRHVLGFLQHRFGSRFWTIFRVRSLYLSAL